MTTDAEVMNRWRLILGKFSGDQLNFSSSDVNYVEMEDVLDYLYNREYGEERGVRGGSGGSVFSVPKWITKMRSLFPKSTVEILEKHALEKYNLTEMLTDKDVLESLEPNTDLLKSILQLKHLMKGEVLESARKIVKKVADEIRRDLENDVRRSILGKLDRNSSSSVKSIRNLDFRKTIRKNLKNYNPQRNGILVDKLYFNNRIRHFNPWRVIIAVDESGSMMDSVIHSAVMAGIFASLPMLKINLVIFDTQVVDLTDYADDPVQTLMSVQLGGGTDISKALGYCNGLIENPHRTIVVLVTDLCEGGPYGAMYSMAVKIVESGARLVILTALDMQAEPVHDRDAAKRMAAIGANVAAMTPEGLSKWIAKVIS